MAVLSNGILGRVSGKVGNIVAGSWKGINYVREKVIPANPQTALQTAQRNKMSYVVLFGKLILTSIINLYWENLYPKMSGFNAFCKVNVPLTNGTTGLTTDTQISQGSLEQVTTVAASYDTATGDIAITWDGTVLGNGEATDNMLIVVFDKSNNVAFVFDGTETRNANQSDQSVGAGRTATSLLVLVSCYRGSGSTLNASNSLGVFATAA